MGKKKKKKKGKKNKGPKMERLVLEWPKGEPGAVITIHKESNIHNLSAGLGCEIRFDGDAGCITE